MQMHTIMHRLVSVVLNPLFCRLVERDGLPRSERDRDRERDDPEEEFQDAQVRSHNAGSHKLLLFYLPFMCDKNCGCCL